VRTGAALAAVLAFLAPPALAAAPGCTAAIDALAAAMERRPEGTQAVDKWRLAESGEAEVVTEGSGGSGAESAQPSESWMGASQGAERAEELLRNARRMAGAGKEDGCRALVGEARRAVGLE
jgi:hypothetical protein